MFGDSPSDYMSAEELAAQRAKWDREDKLKRGKAKKYKLLALRTYSNAELNAELRRRFRETLKDLKDVI